MVEPRDVLVSRYRNFALALLLVPVQVPASADEDERGRVRHGRGVLDVGIRLARVVRDVHAAIHLLDGEGCVSCAGKAGYELSQVLLARKFAVEAYNREPVSVSRRGLIWECPVQSAQEIWLNRTETA